MSNFETDELEEKPLDPAMENVRRKMVRLQLVSGGIMLVMFMAVLGAIVYKVTRTDGKPETRAVALSVPSDAPLTASVALPDGFSVSSVSQSDGQILFYGTLADGGRKAILFDIVAGRIVADVDVNGR
ncbi:hypothetical protein [Mycoplana dimorpha]|uniref:Fimbrial protein n=1 Tax=Mycoplana dimorpha TaxID=28320 RepID=A0A2T5B629_MYCDI|nr:hypothetical protein [Mycoplana dimorpha]PTM94451.1 hypothetical protein C7449_105354 [Mycoplana dimorpha]